jgi:hypothetical protein
MSVPDIPSPVLRERPLSSANGYIAALFGVLLIGLSVLSFIAMPGLGLPALALRIGLIVVGIACLADRKSVV